MDNPLKNRANDPSIRAMGLDRDPEQWTAEQRKAAGVEKDSEPAPLPGTETKEPEDLDAEREAHPTGPKIFSGSDATDAAPLTAPRPASGFETNSDMPNGFETKDAPFSPAPKAK